MKKNILIEVILNNQCNKRCEYCDLDFKNKSLSPENIDLFLDFLSNNSNKVEYFHINFFGGEPLLSFNNLKYFIEKNSIKNIKYSIGTNGDLLNEENIDFLIKNNVSIQLSIDNITGIRNINFLEKYSKFIEINFINDPDYIDKSIFLFDILNKVSFKKINIMPVFTTKTRDNTRFSKLLVFKKYIDKNAINDIMFYGYFNGISSDLQFILDTDLRFYDDMDSLLWLQKQYKILPNDLKNQISIISENEFLKGNLNIDDLIKNHNLKGIVKLVLEIPKILNTQKQNTLIEKILKNGT